MCGLLSNPHVKSSRIYPISQQEARHVVLFQQKDSQGF